MAIGNRFRLEPNKEMTVEEFKRWLLQFDTDGDGDISRDELQDALRSLNVWFCWWKARSGMKIADSNHNGRLDSPGEIENLINHFRKHFHLKIQNA